MFKTKTYGKKQTFAPKVRVQMQHKIDADLGAFEMGGGANIGRELGGVKPLQ